MNATATIVEMKLSPIVAAIDSPTVQVTAQYLAGQFEEFDLSNSVAGQSARDILIATVRGSLPAEVKALALAITGMIEGTRSKDSAGKLTDGPNTAKARKFASMLQSVYGAIRFAGMPILELEAHPSAQALYDASRDYRKAAGNVDWKGTDEATKEATKAKLATKAAVQEAAEEGGIDTADILTMDPEALKALQEAAKAKLATKAAADKLASMEKRAAKMAKDLIQSYGIDDAETVLKRALEMIALGSIPQ